MCQHWSMVPVDLRKAAQTAYRPGQERLDPRPSPAYLDAARRAVAAVAEKEAA